MKKKIIFGSNLEGEKTNQKPICVEYDYYAGGKFGEMYDEEYINIYRGTKHIFISRDYDVESEDKNPRYIITEDDLETKKQKIYRIEVIEEREIDEDDIFLIDKEKEMLSKQTS